MNERTVAIINELCKNRKTVTIGELAEQFDVSQRTIRNDLNTINGFLVENGYDALKLKRCILILQQVNESKSLLPMFLNEFIGSKDLNFIDGSYSLYRFLQGFVSAQGTPHMHFPQVSPSPAG